MGIINWYKKHLDKKVLYYAGIYDFDMGPDGKTSHNNEGDAFKHCFFQAELSFWFGYFIANVIGILHEEVAPNPLKEREMDLHNNKEGRHITKNIGRLELLKLSFKGKASDEIAYFIIEAMNSGKLITHV